MAYLPRHFFKLPFPLIIGWLLVCRPAAGYADEDCTRTVEVLADIFSATNANSSEARHKADDAANKRTDGLALSCVQLQQRQSNSDPKFNGPKPWYSFKGENLPTPTLYKQCGESTCKEKKVIVGLLREVCKAEHYLPPKECDELGKEKPSIIIVNKYESPPRKPLSPGRRVLGGVLIGVGLGTAILGGVHMGVPIFYRDTGCVQYGLAHPCVADRFGLGGALVGLGLAATAGGILALTLP